MVTTGGTTGGTTGSTTGSRSLVSPDFLAEALAQVDDAIIIVDERFCVAYVNAKAARQYEIEASAALGKPLGDIYQYRWLQAGDEEAAMQALAQAGHWRGENLHVLPHGRVLHVESTVTLLRDGTGSQFMLAVIRDMTAQKQAEALLRQSQQWQQLAIEAGQLGTWGTDLDSGATQWDARCRQIYGVGPEEPASVAKGLALIHPDDRKRAMAAFQAAADPSSDGVYKVEKRIVWPDGSIHWIAARGRMFFDEAGGERKARRLTGVVTDISERKQYEEKLLRANQRAALAETATHGFIYEWNMVTGEVERSQGIYQLIGYKPEELAGDIFAWRDLIHPEDFARVGVSQLSKMETEDEFSVEYRLRHRDGHYVHVWDQGIVERDGNGKALRLVGITADISERKAAEEQVRRSEVRLRRMMESSQVGIAFALASGEVLDCNNALLALLGYSRSEFEAGDLNWRQFSLPFDDAFNERLDREIRQTGYVAPHERFLLHKNGQRIPSMVSAALIDTEAQSPNGGEHVAFVVDLSELKQAQVALQEINDTLEQRVALRTAELERSNRELDRFAYIASHDLKSPLRAIEHLSSWVAEDSAATLSPQSQVHLAKLRSRVKRLESLLDDLLLYSRAGRRRHAHEWVDTAEIVRSMVELLSPPPGFQVRVEGELPRLLCERPPFETVLRNLIENAIKHHNRPAAGAVVLSAQVRGDLFEFCVRDNGPGIDPQFHERVFEVFQTLRPRDEVEGSGMGLAIVKKIVENAGGAIRIESAAGQGAAFYFTWKQGEAAGG